VTEVVDHQDARLNYRAERRVVDVSGDRIVTSVKSLKSNYTRTIEYDMQWGLLMARQPNGAATTYSPALPYLRFPATPGQSWQATVTETTSNGATKLHYIRAKVGNWESVVVPAGTFNAIKIELHDEILEDGTRVLEGRDISWYAPEVRRTVKTEESSVNSRSGERRRRTIVLIDYKVQ